MIRKLTALFVLGLALSPFTAPFQTCAVPETGSRVLLNENTSGSNIAPLVTQEGRLTMALPIGVATSDSTPCCPDASLLGLIIPTHRHRSASPTVLRL